MKRIFLFNWEILTYSHVGGTNIIITHNKKKYIFEERGSQFSRGDLMTTFLIKPDEIIEDKETVII